MYLIIKESNEKLKDNTDTKYLEEKKIIDKDVQTDISCFDCKSDKNLMKKLKIRLKSKSSKILYGK